MYGPPLCRKRKMRVIGWPAQNVFGLVGAQSSGPFLQPIGMNVSLTFSTSGAGAGRNLIIEIL